MGTTGIIPDEYWEGLTKLQQRLCISDDAAQAVFAQQVLGKMKCVAGVSISRYPSDFSTSL